MERRREGGDSGGDRDMAPTEHDESLEGAEEDSIALYSVLVFYVDDGKTIYIFFITSLPILSLSACRFFE